MITAPYNFVPLNKEVFYPSWSNDPKNRDKDGNLIFPVHDIPFSDGESGEIDITITAKSPIFIRDHENPEQFCQHNGEYYIPSTSVKGMVRSVLEIMSFGEIIIDEKKLAEPSSVRDMSDSKAKDLVGVATGCGFLKQDAQGKWFIEDYGAPRTIEYTDKKDKIFNLSGTSYTFSLNQNDKNMSAEQKYELLGTNYKTVKIMKNSKTSTVNGKEISRPIAIFSSNGENAYLICTGEITNKEHEFVFASSDKKQTNITNIEDTVSRFKTVYFESDSIDGNYWKNHYNPKIGIPVFYRKKQDGKYDIGLTQLFKLLYPNTIKSAVKQTLEFLDVDGKKDTKLDLTKTIFGTIRKEATSLKGRVYFSHFKTTAKPKVFIKDLTMTLGGPKPSFYPTYISQNCQNDGKVQNDKYNTLMQNNSVIAGWKKYPIHHNKPDVKSVPQSDTTATFNPLGTYKQDGNFEEFNFTGKLRYHNLKPQELGALLSALTFHDKEENFYHNIGLAKAHGFGKIAITVDTEKHKSALQAFEAMMTLWTKEKLQKEWIKTEQIKELFAMHYKETNIDGKLKYLILDPDGGINQFSDAKNIRVNRVEKGRECLPKFSVLSGFSAIPESLLNQEYIEKMKEKKEQEVKAKQEQEAFNLALNSDNPQLLENFMKNNPNHEKNALLEEKLLHIQQAKKEDKFKELNEQAQKAFDNAMAQKDKNMRKKYIASWIKKWSDLKNNQGSSVILALVEKAKAEIK